MNETINSILGRRSIRTFKPQQVSDREINWILETGLYAATSRNMQSWYFTVVQNKDMLKKIRDATANTLLKSGNEHNREKAMDPAFSPFYNAPTIIIVSGNGSKNARVDCANATQNMCVAAYSLGLGSCYLASFTQAFEDPTVSAMLLRDLGMPDGYFPQFAVALGYSAGDLPETPYRRRDVIRYIK